MAYEKYISELKSEGYVHIKGFYEKDIIITIREKIAHIISMVCGHFLGKKIEISDLESPEAIEIIAWMQSKNRPMFSIIYDAIKTLPEFQSLVSSKKNVDLVKTMVSSDFIGITRAGEGIRVDFPGEKKYMAPWHQDYLTQFGSSDGVVLWAPLVNVPIELGPLKILPKSHMEGLLPVYYESESSQNPYTMRIYKEDSLINKYEEINLSCEMTDLLIIDFKTIHKSGTNISNRPRWSMQMRYFNFNDPLGISKGWPGGFYAGKNVAQIHPELLRNNNEGV